MTRNPIMQADGHFHELADLVQDGRPIESACPWCGSTGHGKADHIFSCLVCGSGENPRTHDCPGPVFA